MNGECVLLFLLSSINSFFNACLVLSVLFVYGFGPVAVVEVEHEHEEPQVLAFLENHDRHDHDHHDHGGDEHPSDEGGDDNSSEDHSPHSHRHSHFVSFDLPTAFGSATFPVLKRLKCFMERLDTESVLCPDGPFYDLLKPPQLG